MSSLSQDIKDLRSMIANQKRASVQPPMIIGQPLSESTPVSRPSERNFRDVARRITRLLPHETHEDQDTPMKPMKPESAVPPQLTGASIQPQMTGASVMSEYSTRIVTDLKTKFDEVQNLRRDLGIMRQLYTEFMKTTKESLGTLRTQTQNVRQLATAKVGGARAYIDDGKTKLDSRSQNVLTRMEELQDTVESIKDDVLKRNITPRPQVLKAIKADVEAVPAEQPGYGISNLRSAYDVSGGRSCVAGECTGDGDGGLWREVEQTTAGSCEVHWIAETLQREVCTGNDAERGACVSEAKLIHEARGEGMCVSDGGVLKARGKVC